MAAEQVFEQNAPSGQLLGIKFDLMTGAEIEKFSNVNIIESNDVTNGKLGLPNTSMQCTTCGFSNIRECDGHFGVIKFPMTIYHPLLVSEIVQILNQICPGCKSIKKNMQMKRKLCRARKELLKLRFMKTKLLQKVQKPVILSTSEKMVPTLHNGTACKYCNNEGGWYPKIKFKISTKDKQGRRTLAIIAEISQKLPKKFQNRSLAQVLPKDFWNFIPYPNHERTELNSMTLLPHQAFYLLRQLDPEFIEKFVSRKELLFLSCIPVTPNCHRLVETSHAYSDGPKLSFDERTKAYRNAVDMSRKIQSGDDPISYVTRHVLDCIHTSKLHSNRLVEEDQPSRISGMKWVKEVVLSKRSDNAFRMTMIGDSKIQLGEIGVPQDISDNLYIAERVNTYNIESLKLSCNMHLLRRDLHARIKGKLTSLRNSNQLQVGCTLYRPLEDGDIVLINRPPSVHQHSIIALAVKILPIKSVISINPLCCAPLLGDFDGDCLHGYVPQSICSRVELRELLSLDHQLLNVQDGRSLISLTHDSLTGAHLLSRGGVFFNKYEMQQFEMLCPRESPLPAVIRDPRQKSPLWTGQQLFSMVLPSSMNFAVESSEVEICNGEFHYSHGGSLWLQNSTYGLFTSMFRSYGRKALHYLFAAQEVFCEYLTGRGLSVSLGDLYLTSDAYTRKKMLDEVSYGLEEAEASCYINELMLDPGAEFFLKVHDESADTERCLNFSNLSSESTQINQSSIAAFKKVLHDVQSSIYHYITRDNSLLAMVQAGSKGNLLKLVQQGVCLGLQLASNPLPYKIPHELSCSFWNQHKVLDSYGLPEGGSACGGGQNSYALIVDSLLDGLNPLEFFFHSLSSRSNIFSANADLPGTLTRKLMFYMRDLYVAYDGTVRNSHGQQMIQFSYGSLDETSSIDATKSQLFSGEGHECNVPGGQPVGSWAACSISEAAYGALDHPINSLEASPLLNLKKVLECGPARTSMNRTTSLILSSQLGRLSYGFEYGALEVKNHLQRVFFSDVVTTVMIFYAAHDDDIKGTKLRPWVSHFHLNKESMRRKRLTYKSIINKLNVNYNSMRETWDKRLPKLHFIRRTCSLEAEQGYDETSCIRVAFEASDSPELLDTIRDSVIPILLDTLVKGWLEFKQIDILCDSRTEFYGQPFVKISMSENCSPGKFWCTLQDACIPIMNLIDWRHSLPDSIHDISRALGIGAACKYFLKTLKSATADTGRTVLQKHLLIVSDNLSITGEFHGLSVRGLKQQRDQLSLSSTFTQACLSKPENCFIDAAKQGLVDHLYGAIDAVAWGKEAPVGTGGPFEVIYKGKLQNVKETKSVYESLLSLKNGNSILDPIEVSRTGQGNADKPIGQMNLVTSVSGIKRLKDDGFRSMEHNPKPISQGFRSLSDIVDMVSSLQAILHQYLLDSHLDEADKSTVMEALMYHPKKDAKIGIGVKEIKIGHSPLHPESRCFLLIRNDGTTEDFSYRKCVVGAAYSVSPEFGSTIKRRLFGR